MKRSRGSFVAVLMVVAIGLVFAGCGNGEDSGSETVYLYVTNGYPGASSLTLYGPSGKLVSGLPFGSRTEEPISVDRNVNSTDFTLVFDGAPTEMLFNKPLFSMYPQETGTLIISRRSSEGSADATLYRHVRSPDPDCVMIFGNSLSLDDTLMPDEVLNYSYQTEWNTDPRPMYDSSREQFATTRCGYTPVPDNYKRQDIHSAIQADPWFFPVTGDEGGYQLVWGMRSIDPRTGEQRSEGLLLNGQIWAQPPTADFMECLSGAVTVAQEQDATGAAQGEQQCPTPTGGTGPDGSATLAADQVVWNAEAALSCFELFTYSGFPIRPGESDISHAFGMSPRQNVDPQNPDEWMCGYPIRVRTPFMDLVYQDIDDSIPGYVEGEGGFIEVDGTFPMSEQRFFVLFGRPVNAFVDQWNGEETAVNLEDHPYPGDVVPSYSQDENSDSSQ